MNKNIVITIVAAMVVVVATVAAYYKGQDDVVDVQVVPGCYKHINGYTVAEVISVSREGVEYSVLSDLPSNTVPYRGTIRDRINFLQNYEPTQDSLCLSAKLEDIEQRVLSLELSKK